jgi:hypothetical protein
MPGGESGDRSGFRHESSRQVHQFAGGESTLEHEGQQFRVAQGGRPEGLKPRLWLFPTGDGDFRVRCVQGQVQFGLVHDVGRTLRRGRTSCPVLVARSARWPVRARPATDEAAERGALRSSRGGRPREGKVEPREARTTLAGVTK